MADKDRNEIVDNVVTNICKAYVLTHQKGEKNGSEDL